MTYSLGELSVDPISLTMKANMDALIAKWTYILRVTKEKLQEIIVDTSILNLPYDKDNICVITNDDFYRAAEICIERAYGQVIQSDPDVFARLFSGIFGEG